MPLLIIISSPNNPFTNQADDIRLPLKKLREELGFKVVIISEGSRAEDKTQENCEKAGIAECIDEYQPRSIQTQSELKAFPVIKKLKLYTLEHQCFKGMTPVIIFKNNDVFTLPKEIYDDIYLFDDNHYRLESFKKMGYYYAYSSYDGSLVQRLKKIENLFKFNPFYLMHMRFMEFAIADGFRPGELKDFGTICHKLKEALATSEGLSNPGSTQVSTPLMGILNSISYEEEERKLLGKPSYIHFREKLLKCDNEQINYYFVQYRNWLTFEEKNLEYYIPANQDRFNEIKSAIENPEAVAGLNMPKLLRI